MTPDISKYIGLPFVDHGRSFSGVDCWGLVRLVYKDNFNVTLPTLFEYQSVTDKHAINSLFVSNIASDWEELVTPEIFSVLVFKLYGYLSHVGLFVGRGKMLHVVEGKNVCVESFTSPQWNGRLVGFYKYVSENNI